MFKLFKNQKRRSDYPLRMKQYRKFSKAICRGRYISAKLEHPYTPYASHLLCSGQGLLLSIYLFISQFTSYSYTKILTRVNM